jgi:hypothetical protein
MLRLLTFSLSLCFCLGVDAAERVALVIGNDSYQNVPALKKAAADAGTMAEALSKLGFEVDKGVNVSRTETNRKLQDFLNAIEPGGVALFYFAGHGVEIANSNFLLPTDVPEVKPGSEEFLKSEAISLNTVLDGLRDRKARVAVVVIDACRDNPFALKTGRSVGGTRGLALVVPPQGTFIMYSAGQGQVALDRLNDNDPEPNSVFTRTFVPLLSEGMSLPDLARETRRRVNDLAASVGHSQTPAYYDEVLGDFSFSDRGSAKPLTSPAPTPVPPPKAVAVAPAPPPIAVPTPEPEAQPELARLPEPEPQASPRPRGRNENCSRAGSTLYCVSSMLAAARGNSYGARSLTDGNSDTAWVEGSGDQGIGDFLVLEFDASRKVSTIEISNGYAKTDDIYGKNSRVKDVEIRFSNGESMDTTLSDSAGAQTVSLNRPVETKWVQIVIRSVYPGWKYTDTAINEVRVR